MEVGTILLISLLFFGGGSYLFWRKSKAATGAMYTRYRRLTFVYLGCAAFILVFYFALTSSPGHSSSYNSHSLEDEREEQWLQENFGDGKGQEIQEVIDAYKNDN